MPAASGCTIDSPGSEAFNLACNSLRSCRFKEPPFCKRSKVDIFLFDMAYSLCFGFCQARLSRRLLHTLSGGVELGLFQAHSPPNNKSQRLKSCSVTGTKAPRHLSTIACRLTESVCHHSPTIRHRVRGGSERNDGGSKTTSTRERTPSGSGLGASATARNRRRHPLASARRQGRGWERAQRRGIEDDIHSRAHAVRLGAGGSATAGDRRRTPPAGARRQGRGWERAQRQGIEDDIHSRAHAVRLGAGSERNGGGSKTTSTRERTPSGPGLGASATAADRRRPPLARARRQGRGWERAQRRRIEDDIRSRAHAVRAGAGRPIRRLLSICTYARVSLLNKRRRQSAPGLCEKFLI